MRFSKNNSYRKFFVEKYGVPEEVMEKYEFYERGKSVWAFSGKYVNISKIEVMGIRALRLKKLIKPTTVFMRIIGHYASRNVVHLDMNSSLKFLKGEEIMLNDESVERGFVIVLNPVDILGCGYYTGEKLISEIPKKYRVQNTWV